MSVTREIVKIERPSREKWVWTVTLDCGHTKQTLREKQWDSNYISFPIEGRCGECEKMLEGALAKEQT